MNLTKRSSNTLYHIVFILALGSAIYLNSLSVPLTFDDIPNIANNPAVKDFSLFCDAAQQKCQLLDPKLKLQFASRIVGFFSFFVNYKIHGLSVFGYHIVNIGIHLANALLVYGIVLLLYRQIAASMTTDNRDKNSSRIVALFPALLFVCHPIQTEAVTYIVQRFTSLAAFFYLLSVAGYLLSRAPEKRSAAVMFYFCSFISAILAMKTKEFSLTLPIILTLVDFTFSDSKIRTRFWYLMPFYVLGAAIIVALLTASQSLGNGSSLEYGSSSDISRWDYFITQLTVVVKYLTLLVPPVIQNLDYDYPLYHSFLNIRVLGSSVLLIALFFLGSYNRKVSKQGMWYALHARMISFGIFWFFITIAAESSIIRIKDIIFEHRLYLPSIGLFVSGTVLVTMLKEMLHRRQSALEHIVLPCVIFLIMLLSFATFARNEVWQDEIRLWQDTAAKSPNKPRAHNNLALAYFESGYYQDALEENLLSLKLKQDPGIHLNIANIYLKQKRFVDAFKEFESALSLKPDFEKAFNGMCSAYYQQQRYADAMKACNEAVKLKPDYAEAHNIMGMVAFDQGDIEGALKKFNTSISFKPDFAIAHNNAGNAFFKMKNFDAALKEYQIVSSLDRNYIGVRLSIGKTYHEMGRLNDAVNEYNSVLAQKPNLAEAKQLMEITQRAMLDKYRN